MRARLGLDPDAVLIGCFGRIRAQKASICWCRRAGTAALAPTVQDHLHRRITPDNRAFADDLQARIKAAGLDGRIRFLGELPWDQVIAHYQALDLFAAPARWRASA